MGSVFAEPEAVDSGGTTNGGRRLGAKGRRTRARILAAAAAVLVDDGWSGATISAIAERAGVGIGTMYQYFRSKQEVMATIVDDHARVAVDQLRGWDPAEGRDGLNRLIDRFVTVYAASAGLQRVWEEVSLVEPDMGDLRRDLTDVYVHRFADAFAAGAASGLLDPGPDPVETARALCAMVDRYCLQVYDRHRPATGTADVVALLTDLWARALRLE